MAKMLLGLLLLFPYIVKAEKAVELQYFCLINGGNSAVCEACNFSTYQPLYCEMKVYAQTSEGFEYTGSKKAWLPAGRCLYGIVYAQNPDVDPLIHSDASVLCKY